MGTNDNKNSTQPAVTDSSERKKLKHDAGTYPLQHVPESARRAFFPVASILIGFTFFSPTIVAGAQIGAHFNFKTLLLLCLVANLILGTYAGIMCAIGARAGLGAVMLSKYTLGKVGVKWADILLGGTEMGWYAVNANFIGSIYADALGQPHMVVFWTIFWGLIMGATAIYGFKAVTLIAYMSLPMIVVLVGLMPLMVISKVGSLAGLFSMSPMSQGMSIATAVTVIIGTFAAGATQSNNWSKFCRNGKQGFVAGFFAFFIGNALMVLVGMLGAVAFQQSDVATIFKDMGILFIAVIILTFNLWSSQNAGSSAVGFAATEFFGKDHYRTYIAIGILISIVIAITGVYSYFIPFLVILGTVIPPLGGTIIGDFFFTWKGHLPKLDYVSEFKLFRISTVLSYIIGTLVAVVTNHLNLGLPSLQGIVVSVLCVPLINAILKAAGINDTHKVLENAEYTK